MFSFLSELDECLKKMNIDFDEISLEYNLLDEYLQQVIFGELAYCLKITNKRGVSISSKSIKLKHSEDGKLILVASCGIYTLVIYSGKEEPDEFINKKNVFLYSEVDTMLHISGYSVLKNVIRRQRQERQFVKNNNCSEFLEIYNRFMYGFNKVTRLISDFEQKNNVSFTEWYYGEKTDLTMYSRLSNDEHHIFFKACTFANECVSSILLLIMQQFCRRDRINSDDYTCVSSLPINIIYSIFKKQMDDVFFEKFPDDKITIEFPGGISFVIEKIVISDDENKPYIRLYKKDGDNLLQICDLELSNVNSISNKRFMRILFLCLIRYSNLSSVFQYCIESYRNGKYDVDILKSASDGSYVVYVSNREKKRVSYVFEIINNIRENNINVMNLIEYTISSMDDDDFGSYSGGPLHIDGCTVLIRRLTKEHLNQRI